MKYFSVFSLSLLTYSFCALSATLEERDPSVYNYDVLFTNPTCSSYTYPKDIKTNGGNFIRKTPENVFCTRSDKKVTAARDGSDDRIGYNESPQHRLLKLINDKNTKSIFMTYLSFSDSDVARALCKRMSADDMQLELVIDKTNENGSIDRTLGRYLNGETLTRSNRARAEKALKKAISSAESKVKKLIRSGNTQSLVRAKKDLESLLTKSQYLGSILCSKSGLKADQNYTVKRMAKPKGINWSHTKVFMVNPNDKKKVTIAFASANMSSGTTLHHENWHFVTSASESHFVQIHLCLKEAEFNHASSRKEFMNYMKKCRSKIALAEEDDIKTFIAPGEGEKAIRLFTSGIKNSKNISIAAHRFTLRPLMAALKAANKSGSNIRLVFDDDMYLAGEGIVAEGVRVPNMPFEYKNVMRVLANNKFSTLESDGVEARYMQTNHFEHTIHHNKYIIMDNEKDKDLPPAVFCGAGNFTSAAFMTSGKSTNLENYYYITIPSVVEAFQKQYKYKWTKLATKYKDLPTVDLRPSK